MKCTKCNAKLTDVQNFCSLCGTAVVKDSEGENEKEQNSYLQEEQPQQLSCEACGTELTPNSAFCFACGLRVEKKKILTQESCFTCDRKKASASESRCSVSVRGIIKKSVIAFVSLIVLIFAFFPVATYTLEPYIQSSELEDCEVNLSAVDCIALCFDAMNSMDSEDIAESDAYDEYLEWLEVLYDEDSDDDELKEAYGKVAFYQLKLALFHEDANFRLVYSLSALLSLLFILMALAVLVLSVLDLVLYLTGRTVPVLGKLVNNFLAVIPTLTILLYATATYSYFMPISLMGAEASTSVTATAVFVIILSLGVLAYLAVDRIFLSGKIRINVKEIVCRSLSSVFACVLLFTMFMPVISFNVKTVFAGKTKTESASVAIDASYFGSFDISEQTLEEYDDMAESAAMFQIKSAFSTLGQYSKKEFSRGETNAENRVILNHAFLGFGGADSAWLMAMIPIVLLLIGAIAAILLWQNIIAIAEGASPRGALTVTVRIIAIVLAVIAVALVTVFVAVSNYNLNTSVGRGHAAAASVNAGTIVALIFSVALMCVPMGKKKKATALGGEDI